MGETMAAERDTFAGRLAWVEEAIRRAAFASGRAPERVKLVAVSKTHPAERLQEAFDAGCRRFGENYIQEAHLGRNRKRAHPPGGDQRHARHHAVRAPREAAKHLRGVGAVGGFPEDAVVQDHQGVGGEDDGPRAHPLGGGAGFSFGDGARPILDGAGRKRLVAGARHRREGDAERFEEGAPSRGARSQDQPLGVVGFHVHEAVR